MSFETLLPLIEKTESHLSPTEFHHAVNVAFHDIEAEYYDAIHANMWESLADQINLLVTDIIEKTTLGTNLTLLDIGCGTGLSTELLLNSKLKNHIRHVTLLDTSPKMLEKAAEKLQKQHIEFALFNGDVHALDKKYDVIIVSSVLHHIPDLKAFLKKLDTIQNPGAILIQLQDPNGDFMNNAEYRSRFALYDQKIKSTSGKKLKDFLPNNIKIKIKKWLGIKSYMDLVNDKLLETHVIKRRMREDEIWSVTDIHVESLPFSIGHGISIKFMTENLPNYSLVKMRSYGFFGFLKSELLAEFQTKESNLIAANAMNGRYVSATWIKK